MPRGLGRAEFVSGKNKSAARRLDGHISLGDSRMRLRFELATRAAGAALLLLCASVPALAQGTGRVTGTVTETSGTPLQGVTVTVVGTHRMGVPDPAGRYTIANVAAGTQRLRATRLGFLP